MTIKSGSERYDVAFSFLEQDKAVAHELRQLLEPALRVFVYDREQEAVGGRDGAEGYASIFKHETRLTVILYRDGWGGTRFTGIEEAAIRDRATLNRYRSVMVVMMEPKQSLPTWIPETTVYQHGWDEPRTDTAAVIRARAREAGAVLKPVTLIDVARQRAEKQRLREECSRILQAPEGVVIARQEALRLMRELLQHVEDFRRELPDVPFRVEREELGAEADPGLIIVGEARKLSVWWRQPWSDTLRDTRLEIGDLPAFSAHGHRRRTVFEPSWSIYDFAFTEEGEPGWRYRDDPNSGIVFFREFKPTPTRQFAEERMRRLIDACLPED